MLQRQSLKNCHFTVTLHQFSQVDMSIDGVTEEQCDRVRGKGVFSKVLSAIDLLQGKGLKNISLSMAFDDNVCDSKDTFRELCEKKAVRALVRTMSPSGRAKDNHKNIESCYDFLNDNWSSYFSFYNCPGGKTEVLVSAKGHIYPCSTFKNDKYLIGKVSDQNIRDKLVWDESLSWFKNFKQFIPEYRDECRECEVRPFCWSCPNSLNDFFNKTGHDTVKPHCLKKQQKMMTEVWENEIQFYTKFETIQ